MSTRRTITVTLTEPEYQALGVAVAGYGMIPPGSEDEEAALERAWMRLNTAWHVGSGVRFVAADPDARGVSS